ncbi:MAG: hypothetical protein IKV97_00345 [Clostridia bacterium]|nr:hypothetical protein [Clostridia bacterium]
MAEKKRYRVNTRKPSGNKKLALLLLLSMVIFIGTYFGCIKARFAVVQDIYIWSAFFAAVVYMCLSTALAVEKQKNDAKKEPSAKAVRLDRARKLLLLILIPMIFALLCDYMLLYLGWAGYFGI